MSRVRLAKPVNAGRPPSFFYILAGESAERPLDILRCMTSTIRLTKRQEELAFKDHPKRQKVRGVAGSGKTLVIAARAVHRAKSGKRVLIITFNITLPTYIKTLVMKLGGEAYLESNIRITTYHALCRRMVRNAEQKNGESYYQALARSFYITTANIRDEEKFDVVLVDEAQDLEALWVESLTRLVKADGEFLLVADTQQNLYDRNVDWIEKGLKGSGILGRWAELNERIRLPANISRLASTFARKRKLPSCLTDDQSIVTLSLGDPILDPEIVWRHTRNPIEDELTEALRYLEETKKQSPSSITILVHSNEQGYVLSSNLGIAVEHTFGSDDIERNRNRRLFGSAEKAVKMTTFHGFKGWEADNVIVVVPERAPDQRCDVLVYNGITRTKKNLIIIDRTDMYRDFAADFEHRGDNHSAFWQYARSGNLQNYDESDNREEA